MSARRGTPAAGAAIGLPVRALLVAAWRGAYNDGWRFSRVRTGLWRALLQVVPAGLFFWRLSSVPPVLPAGTLALLAFAEAWLLALLGLLLRGRRRLYTGPLVRLVHLSPTPAEAVVIADVIAATPGHAWTALLLAVALSPAARGAELWAGAAMLLAALAGGCLGHLTGLAVLLSLVRRWPGALVAIPAVGMLLALTMAGWLTYLFTVGLWRPALSGLGAPAPGAGGVAAGELALVLLLSLPGLLCFTRLLKRWDGEAHREGWLAVCEMADRQSRPLRSRWPALVRGPAGALQAGAWLAARRNWFSLIRLGYVLSGLALPLWLGRFVAESRADTLCLAAGLLFAVFNYGEQAAALFAADGERAALALLAGAKPHQLLLGKWLAGLPLPLVAGLTTLTWALSVGLSPAQVVVLAAVSLAVALGCLTWIVGAAAFDAAPGRSAPQPESGTLALAFEQVPTRPGGVVGLAGGAVLAGTAVWLHAGAPAWLPVLAVPPVLAAAAGLGRLARLVHRGVGE